MNTVILAGVFGILGSLVGAAATWIIQMQLRREKFKEIIYKEKLVSYQGIAQGMEAIKTVLAPWLANRIYPGFEVVNSQEKQAELSKKEAQFRDLVGCSLVVSPEAKKKLMNFGKAFIELFSVLFKEITGEVSPSVVDATIEVFDQNYADAFNTMRKELLIKPINKSLLKTFPEVDDS